MADKPHAILGASSSHRWLACPGSIRLSAGMPSTSSVYADEGTAAHELAEKCLSLGHDAADHLGEIIVVNGTGYEVTDEMAEAVQVYLNVVRQELAEAGEGAELKVEQRFDLGWLYPGLYGTNDAMVGQPFGTLKVFDYKHGAGVAVEAECNPQLLYYGLGAAYGDAYEEVELVIVQPRAYHPDGPVRRYRISIGGLFAWAESVLLPGAKATEDPAAPLVPGEHCRFCPAVAVCPKQHENALAVAKEVFAPVPQSPPAPEALTHEDLRRIMDAADMVESWLSAVRSHVRTLLENGLALPDELGYKLVAGKASRKWKSEEEATKLLQALLPDPDEAYAPRKLLSPAQAEKLLKGPAKKALEEVVEVSRGVSLAPLSDKREAIVPAIAAFGEVEL